MGSVCKRVGLVAVALAVTACGSVPFTERSQLRLISESQEISMGIEAYQEILKDERVITGTPEAEMVQRVGRRIAATTGENFQWEFKLIDDPDTVNAFCLPGGKVAVYTGILPITQNEDGLAAVIGHEVAHATAHHGAERVSQELISQGVLGVAEVSLGGADAETRDVVMAGLGLGTQVGFTLPYSRTHEYEADAIGLRYLVRAGYNPHESVRLWQRMAAQGGERQPEFLSTHPEPAARAERLARLIPKVVAEERAAANPR